MSIHIRQLKGGYMQIIRCDGCGNEVRTDVAGANPKSLGFVLSVSVGKNNHHDAHACSLACFDKAIESAQERARADFGGVCRSVGAFEPDTVKVE